MHVFRRPLALACALCAIWPSSASTAEVDTPPEHLLGIIQATIDSLTRGAVDSEDGTAPETDGPITALPPIQDLLAGRMDVWLNPLYWSTWVQESLLHGNIQIPAPTDVVRPEIWTANVDVANDAATVTPMRFALQDTSGITYQWREQTKTVADFVATTETDTVVFVHNGALVDEIYNNGYQEYTRQQPWSVTKTFIAAVVGIADGEGRIQSLQDPIERYIPDLAGTPWEGVSIEDILQMESGVHWDEDTPVLPLNTQVQQWVQVLLDYYTYGALGQTRNEFIKALPAAYEAGTEFRYNSANTQVLAWMLSNLYGKPFNEIISEKLWIPMGAYGDARMIADREGATIASQGLYARAHDFARFGELMRRGGVNARGEQVVPAAWIDRMTRMTKVSEGGYGYQTWNSAVTPGAYKASGFQGQKITVVPEYCLTAVRLSHSFGLQYRDGDIADPDAYGVGTNFSADEWVAMVKAVADSLGDCDGSAPSRSTTTLEADAGGPGGSSGSGALGAWAAALLGLLALGRRRMMGR